MEVSSVVVMFVAFTAVPDVLPVPPDPMGIGVDALIVVATTAPFQPVERIVPAEDPATEKPTPGLAQ